MILDFKEIRKEDILVAGGKGANLGEMTSAKINVPNGFVITADAYREFLKENSIEKFIREKIVEVGNDENKLLYLTDSNYQYKYKYGLSLIIKLNRGDTEVKIFIDGKTDDIYYKI